MRLFNASAVGEKGSNQAVERAAASRRPAGSPNCLQSPPRIVHVAETIAGGIASFFEEIAPYQTRAFGAENVTFIIPAGSEVHVPSIAASQIVTFAASSRGPGALLAFGRQATAAIRRLDPDIVHLHSSFAGAVLRVALGRREGKPRIIYCPHGWAFAMECGRLKQRLYAAIERRLARDSDLIIVNSQSERDLAVKFGLPESKLQVVHNGVAWSPRVNRGASGANGAKLRVAFIGRHDKQKGLDVLLDTIEQRAMGNFEFHVVGASVLGQSSARLASGQSPVKYHGWLDRKSIDELLSRMDAVVMPSRWEAFGLVAIEAMRAGVPVIASNRGALPEIVRHGVGGYVFDLDDPDALGRLLASLDRGALDKLRQSARTRWESEFTGERMNELTEQAYERVLGVGWPKRPRGASAEPAVMSGARHAS